MNVYFIIKIWGKSNVNYVLFHRNTGHHFRENHSFETIVLMLVCPIHVKTLTDQVTATAIAAAAEEQPTRLNGIVRIILLFIMGIQTRQTKRNSFHHQIIPRHTCEIAVLITLYKLTVRLKLFKY